MRRSPGPLIASLLLAGSAFGFAATAAGPNPPVPGAIRAVRLSPARATLRALRQFRRDGSTGVVLDLDGEREAVRRAASRVSAAGLDLYYWVEIARCPALADAHPEWMASLQGHPEWRRLFPAAPQPGPGEVVKNYPWVPIVNREAFDAQLSRVQALLKGQPPARGIFLNDLQAAPSACGCGNLFCRWIADYGPLRTATPLGPDAAARFVAAVGKLAPRARIIPVWTTECEEHEAEEGGACGGVPCYPGKCWYAWTEQLMPVARQSGTLGVLATYRDLGRDDPRYGPAAGWVRRALAMFVDVPPKRGGKAVPAGRLIAILQGWNVTAAERQAQIRQARQAGAGGYVLSEEPIPQGWEPRLLPAGTVRSPQPANTD